MTAERALETIDPDEAADVNRRYLGQHTGDRSHSGVEAPAPATGADAGDPVAGWVNRHEPEPPSRRQPRL